MNIRYFQKLLCCQDSKFLPIRVTIMVIAAFFMTFLLSACQSGSGKPAVDLEVIQQSWDISPHAHTYGLDKGPNTYCARCHAPQNWDPASKVDQPPNCVTCKFPMDQTIRQATTMAFVEEQDWKNIGCDVCHPVDKNGKVSMEIAWLNSATDLYEEVNTPNELCGKCHATTSGVSVSGGRGVAHGIVLGGSAHVNWAGAWPQEYRPQYCTDCHDPHSTDVKQCDDCHQEVLTSATHIKGYNVEHGNVSCMACHDSSGMEVGPHPDGEMGGLFVTLETYSVGIGEEPIISPMVSHSVQWQAACDRCHFAGNPWDLTVLTASGE